MVQSHEERNKKKKIRRAQHYQSVRQHFIKLLGGKCTKCETVFDLEIDHIIPNGWGGGRGQENRMWDWFPSYAEGNLQLLCKEHNREKSTKNKEHIY